ncbi:MAG TPA: ABC transporter permease [Ktedonobacterales bacterium]|nr:ABC transporter permease [Ktedonobacterales bacterium]
MLEAVRRPARGVSLRESVRESARTFRVAVWLGWQIESSWADPFVFFSFTILRPLATALMLLVMYQIVAQGQSGGFFSYLYLSNAFFVLVIQAMAGVVWTIFDDRENYRMLKYIYTSPARKFPYLIGRAMGKVAIAMLTILVLLTVGIVFLGLHLNAAQIEWGWLIVYFLLGMVVLISLGIILAGVGLVVARHGGSIGEVVAGMLLLFSGAYFPPDILPPVLKQVTLALPITYWLEAMRRTLNGGIITATYPDGHGAFITGPVSPLLAQFDNWQLLLILLLSAVGSAVASFFFYRWIEFQAKERGMIDRLTGY